MFDTQILILAIVTLLFISVSILVNLLCCQMCTFYCPLRKNRCTVLPEGTDVHIWQHIKKNIPLVYDYISMPL